MRRILHITQLLVLLTLLFIQIGCTGTAACDERVNNTQEKLLECVTVEGMREHLAAFQTIADENGGTRAVGTAGYDASVAYVVDRLEEAGYEAELNGFEFTFVPPETLQQIAPINATYKTGAIIGTGSGAVTGPVIPVDLALGQEPWPADPSTSTSGCEASDFDRLDFSGPNDIALVQGGACLFSVKAINADTAGAEAVIFIIKDAINIMMGLPAGKVSLLPDGSPSNLTIPVIGTSFPNGVVLSQDGSEAFVDSASPVNVIQYNVLAELPGEDDGIVVMVGAHLDSVQAGPGISDNGSGSAAILETAVQMSKVKPHNKVRFAWWGAEESGLDGSKAYVNGLTQEEQDDIALYLNFDMIGSPNYAFIIFDRADSDGKGSGRGPEGSAEIVKLFESYYLRLGLPFTDYSGCSDHCPFIGVGIPASGLFTGADRVKTEKEAALWGGTAKEQYDPCNHQACDTFDNINLEALDVNSDAVAFATLHYAMNTDSVTDLRGKSNVQLSPGISDHIPETE